MLRRLTPRPDIADALHAMYPDGAMFSVDEDGNVEWMPDNVHAQPSKEEIAAKHEELLAKFDAEQLYVNQRIEAYPEYHEQLDMLFHLGYDGWKAAIQEIKDQFPKPE